MALVFEEIEGAQPDEPWACTGAAFVDLVLLLPSVGLGGGPDPQIA